LSCFLELTVESIFLAIPSGLITFLDQGLLNLSGWGRFAVFMAMTHLTIISVTLYLHRCQSHRALELHPAVSHVFRFWLWFTTGQNTKAWAAIHRKHHAKCETDEDPHSPQTRGLWAVFSRGAELYRAEAKVQETLDKYGHGTPDDWIEKHVYTPYSVVGVSLCLPFCWVMFGLGWGTAMWAGIMAWIPVMAAGIINGIGHFWGYRNNNSPDASKNLMPWGLLIGGEELHNNHHTYATSPKFSSRPWEFDLGWAYIQILSFFGLAKARNLPEQTTLLANAKPIADHETLTALVAARFSLMRHYGKVLKDAVKHERDALQPMGLFSSAKKLLPKEQSTLALEDQTTVNNVLAASDKLAKLHAMRDELALLWARSSQSREQLLQQLQDWCHRAESSGVRHLQELSVYLRRVSLKA
jgi:stearoyl-CoA desaturase (Delta-9 desaturase)